MNKLSKYLISLVLFFGYGLTASIASAETYTFGIVPQQNGSKLSKTWTPILKYIEQKTGYQFKFSTARNISTFEKRVSTAKYDIVYMNPFHYTLFHDTQGYEAFAKAKDKKLKGIIVVSKDSPYKSLSDLNNAELAFPSHAFAANLVPRAILNKQGVSFSSKYVASHDSVYRNVAKGRYQAGGGVMRTFRNTSPAFRDNLRVLWSSDGYTPHAFASHPRVPQHVVQKLQQVMLEMSTDPIGKQLLKELRLNAIEQATNNDWNDVRALNIKS